MPQTIRKNKSIRPFHCYKRPIESLETRMLITGVLTDVANQLEPRLNSFDLAMGNISDAANKFPIIGKSAGDIAEIRQTFSRFAGLLPSALRSIDQGSPNDLAIRTAIADVLGNQLDVLGNRDGNPIANANDISVTDLSSNSITVDLDLHRQFDIIVSAQDVSLGLDALPIKFKSGDGTTFRATLNYNHLRFGWNNGGFFFDTSALNELNFSLSANLPHTTQLVLGMFYATATDIHDGDDFIATLSADMNGFGIQNPTLSGSANINLRVESGIDDQVISWLPKIRTDVALGWSFGGTNPHDPHGSFGMPTLSLNNVSISIPALFGSFLGPIASALSKVTTPTQDFLDSLYSPIPGLSDLSNTIGGPDLTIAELAEFNNFFPSGRKPLGDDFSNFVHATSTIREFSKQINTIATGLAASSGTAWVNLGNYNLGGPTGSLLVNGGQVLGNTLGVGTNWSSLVAGGADISHNELINRIRSVSGALGDLAADAYDQFKEQLSEDGVFFSYPFMEDPKTQLMNAILGQGDAEFVKIQVRFQKPIANFDIPFPIIGPLAAVFHFDLDPDCVIDFGYDSRGVRRTIEKIINGANVAGALSTYLDDGLYIQSNSRLKLSGTIYAGGGLFAPGLHVIPNGNLTASIDVHMDVPNAEGNIRKIRPFGETVDGDELIGTSLFHVQGSLVAGAGVTTTVGVGAFSYTKTINFAEKTLFSFDTYDNNSIPSPFLPPGPPILAERTGLFGDLVLQMGSPALRQHRGIASGDTNEQFFIRQFVPADNFGQEVIEVTAYGISQTFAAGSLSSIRAIGEDGNDMLTVDSSVTVPVYFDGGDGKDTLIDKGTGQVSVYGGNGDDHIDVNLSQFSDIHGGNDNDTIIVYPLSISATPFSANVYGEDGNDTLTLGSLPANNLTTNFYGGAGDDYMSIPVPQGNPLMPWYTPGGIAVDGGGGTGDVFVWNTQTPFVNVAGQLVQQPTNDDLFIQNDRIIRNSSYPVTVFFTNVYRLWIKQGGGNDRTLIQCSNQRIDIDGGDGDDYFSSGGSGNEFHVYGGKGDDTFNHWAGTAFSVFNQQEMYGGDGIDTLELDVHLANTSFWSIMPNSMYVRVNGGPISPFNADGWEGVQFTGTSGVDTVNVTDGVDYNLFINTLGGSDTAVFNHVKNPIENNPLPGHVQINNNIGLKLGGDLGDSVTVFEDSNNQTVYDIGANDLVAREPDGLGHDPSNVLRVGPINDVQNITLLTSSFDDSVSIDDAGINRYYTISTLGGNDSITFRGLSTYQQEATIVGGNGYDALWFDDSLLNVPADYRIAQDWVASAHGLFTTKKQYYSNIESVNVIGGLGNDLVELLSPSAAPLGVAGGGGNDVVNISGSAFNGLQLSGITLSGGDGNDSVFWDDHTLIQNFLNYGLTSTSFGRSFGVSVNYSAFEQVSILAGSGNDEAYIYSTSANTTFNGGGGNDNITVGGITGVSGGGYLSGVVNPTTIDGGTGTNALAYNNVLDNADHTLHFDGSKLGTGVGDNLFAAGGSVSTSNISSTTVNLGTGADTIYTQLPSVGTVTFNAGSPTFAPGDSIILALAGIPDYTQVATGIGSGRIDIAGTPRIIYTGIEQSTNDTYGPAIDSTDFSYMFGFHAFYVTMTEPVTFSPNPFVLYNDFTNEPFAPGMAVAGGYIGGGLSISFPGFPNNRLPDGRYRLVLDSSKIHDYAGNAFEQPANPITFFFLSGDANHDGYVDPSDQGILTNHLGEQMAPFSHGDFNGDFVVNELDQAILDNQFHKYIPQNSLDAFPATSGDDSILIRKESGVDFTDIYLNGDVNATYRMPFGAVLPFNYNGGEGNDDITIDYANGNPVSNYFNLDGGDGADSITLLGTSGDDQFSAFFGTLSLNTTFISKSNIESVIFDPGAGMDSVSIFNDTVSIPANPLSGSLVRHFSNLTLSQNAVLKFDAASDLASRTLLVTSNLSIDPTAQLNLGNSDLIYDWDTQPIYPSPYDSLVNKLKSGLTLLGGNGTAGITSAEVDNQTVSGTFYAILDNSDPNLSGGLTSMSGYSGFSEHAILIKYTWLGDCNLDGVVDGSDYALVDTGFTSSGSLGGWLFGDIDYGGLVDGSDYALVDTGFIAQNGIL